jgi:hypothetical protein
MVTDIGCDRFRLSVSDSPAIFAVASCDVPQPRLSSSKLVLPRKTQEIDQTHTFAIFDVKTSQDFDFAAT